MGISWLVKCPRWRSYVYKRLVCAKSRLNFTETVSAPLSLPQNSLSSHGGHNRQRLCSCVCDYCPGRPSTWCCRDHSAGRSLRRATPRPVGEPAIDGRLDQIGREESKRDGHVDLSRAAVFSRRDVVRTGCCLAADIGSRGIILGVEGIKVLLQPLLGRDTGIDRAANRRFESHATHPFDGLSRRPKNRGPFQRVSVIANATLERLG